MARPKGDGGVSHVFGSHDLATVSGISDRAATTRKERILEFDRATTMLRNASILMLDYSRDALFNCGGMGWMAFRSAALLKSRTSIAATLRR